MRLFRTMSRREVPAKEKREYVSAFKEKTGRKWRKAGSGGRQEVPHSLSRSKKNRQEVGVRLSRRALFCYTRRKHFVRAGRDWSRYDAVAVARVVIGRGRARVVIGCRYDRLEIYINHDTETSTPTIMTKRCASGMPTALKLSSSFSLISYPRISIAVGLKDEGPEIRVRQAGQTDFPLTMNELKSIFEEFEPDMDQSTLSMDMCHLTGNTEECQLALEDGRYVLRKKLIPHTPPMDDFEVLMSINERFYIPVPSLASFKEQAENAYNHAKLIVETYEAIRGMYTLIMFRYNQIVNSTNKSIQCVEEEYDEVARCLRIFTPSFVIVRDFRQFLNQRNLECVFCYYSVMESALANHAYLKNQLKSASTDFAALTALMSD